MEKMYIKWDEFHKDCDKVAIEIASNNPSPDYMICLSRGGVVPGRIMAEIVKPKRFLVLGVKLFEGMERGDNVQITQDISELTETDRHDRVLIVDDICDSGETFERLSNYIKENINHECDVRFSALWWNNECDFEPHYYTQDLAKDTEQVWIYFPHENWWEGSIS